MNCLHKVQYYAHTHSERNMSNTKHKENNLWRN